MAAKTTWSLRGEMTLSCNCTLFCPCVLSLGLHPPTEGFCQTWVAIRIDQGTCGKVDLGGINVCLMIEIPGSMSRGNWTVGLMVDQSASTAAFKSLTDIMTGKHGGSTHLMTVLVGAFLEPQRVPISYRTDGETRIINVDKILEGIVNPIAGKASGENVVIRNSNYWISPDVTVARADKSRLRTLGRNWNFAGRSAEICKLDWGNA